MLHVASLFCHYLKNRSGNFGLIAGILSPVLFGLIGGVVDYMIFMNHRAELQATADNAVLAVAKEASLKGWNAQTAKQVAGAIVLSSLTNRFGDYYEYELHADEKARRIDIELSQDHYGYFVLGYFAGSPQIEVAASAIASGVSTICIITQHPSQNDAMLMSGDSTVRAPGCAAYSNSVSSKGVNVKDASTLRTQLTCSAGGFSGKPSNYTPMPLTDCPRIGDPLSSRARMIDDEVNATVCVYSKLKIKGGTRVLKPGAYCGGLEITDGAQVQFEPGIHIIRDGKMKVDKSAKISGSGVGFVYSGKKAELDLKNASTVALSAPEAGLMSGILLYAQPESKKRKFSIVSKNAQQLVGTVYLPQDTLSVGGDDDGDGLCDATVEEDGTVTPPEPSCVSDVGTASAWTAIIVEQLKVTAGSTLVVNANYDDSNVPVPEGIGPNSNRVILTR